MATPGIGTTGNLTPLLLRSYHKIAFDEYKRPGAMWSKVANVMDHKEYEYKKGQLIGLKSLRQMHEGQAPNVESFETGNEKTTYTTEFGMGFALTRRVYEDDLTGHLKKGFEELGKAARYTHELKFWDVFNNGTDADAYAGFDGKSLYADDHTTHDGLTTIDNALTGSLSMDVLEAMVQVLKKTVNERSVPTPLMPDLLIIPTELEWQAKELLLSPLMPDTGNNNINPAKEEGIKYMTVPYLTSTTGFHLLAKEHDITVVRRRNFQTRNFIDNWTKNHIFIGDMAFTCTFWDFRGAVGSTGT